MKIAIVGHTHRTEYPFEWDMKCLCPLKRLANRLKAGDGQEILDDMIVQLADREIVVFPGMGVNLAEDMPIILNAKNGHKLFENPRRAFWSLDSHHWAGPEQEIVPKYFTSHYSSFPERLGKEAYFLPPGVWGLTPLQIMNLPVKEENPLISVISLFRKYGADKTLRDARMQQYVGSMRKLGISHLVGQAEDFPVYLSLMNSAYASLNMSLDGEINARAFEALMFNHVLVSNTFATPQMLEFMKQFQDNQSLLYYDAGNDDMDHFEQVISNALTYKPLVETRKMIADRHCICHRISEIIFNESADHSPKAAMEVAYPPQK